MWTEGTGSGWLLLASGGSWCGRMHIMKTGGSGARGSRLISRASRGVRLLSGLTQCCITGTEEGAGAEEGSQCTSACSSWLICCPSSGVEMLKMVKPITCTDLRKTQQFCGLILKQDLFCAWEAEVAGEHGVAVEKAAVDGSVCDTKLLAEKAGTIPVANIGESGFVWVKRVLCGHVRCLRIESAEAGGDGGAEGRGGRLGGGHGAHEHGALACGAEQGGEWGGWQEGGGSGGWSGLGWGERRAADGGREGT